MVVIWAYCFSAAAALGTLQLLHVRVATTRLWALFRGARVRTPGSASPNHRSHATQIVRARTFVERRARLAVSDLLLFFIVLNVSFQHGGLGRGEPTQLPLPIPFDRWHLDSGFILVLYLVVHVGRGESAYGDRPSGSGRCWREVATGCPKAGDAV